MHLIVGLGNPGTQYEATRHNVGFMAVDDLLRRHSHSPIRKSAFHGDLFRVGDLLLLKPTTFMNLSGKSVAAVKNFYKIEQEKIIVIHDELDLPFGALRYKRGGGHGGHNGLKSLDSLIGADYLRVRIGIGRPVEKSMVTSYVLHPFDEEQGEKIPGLVEKGASAALALTKNPLETVSARFSQKSC